NLSSPITPPTLPELLSRCMSAAPPMAFPGANVLRFPTVPQVSTMLFLQSNRETLPAIFACCGRTRETDPQTPGTPGTAEARTAETPGPRKFAFLILGVEPPIRLRPAICSHTGITLSLRSTLPEKIRSSGQKGIATMGQVEPGLPADSRRT